MAAKEHKVQVIKRGVRYIAFEKSGRVTFTRDGDPLGTAKWHDDLFMDSTALLPDDVCAELEAQIKAGMDSNWGDG